MTVLRIPEGLSLYDASGFEFVEQIRQLAEALHRAGDPTVKAVLLVQKAVADDRCISWANELRDSLLLKDLADRIDTLRWTLSLIRNSPVPWIYASQNDCFGSHWELASACYKRYWFASRVRVGFPEIASGAFPPGGTLESLEKRVGKVRERWRDRPICFAWEAARDGLIDFCSNSDDFESDALGFFDGLINASQGSQRRGFERKTGRRRYDFDSDLKARNATVERLTEVWREGESRQAANLRPEAWQYCWQLVSDKSFSRSSHERGRVISFIAAHYFLTQSFQVWLSGGVVRRKFITMMRKKSDPYRVLYIDLNLGKPPTESIKRIFDSGWHVVFFSDDNLTLVQRLTQIFDACGIAEDIWMRQVTWFQGAVRGSRNLVLRCGPNDKVSFQLGATKLDFLWLERGDNTFRLGSLEWLTSPEAKSIETDICLEFASIVSNGLVESQRIGPSGVSLSTYIRSLFLEELAKVGTLYAGDLSRVLESLQSYGWGFAASEDSWQAFLQARVDDHFYDADLTKLDGSRISKLFWEVRTWREFRQIARRSFTTEGQISWSSAQQSRHMGQFLGLLALHLAKFMGSIDGGDYLCARALGFPSAYGTPITFLRLLGRRRLDWFTKQQRLGTNINNLWEQIL